MKEVILMYLKSIKAYGFKSFADKIEINFGENINGIVGPNGSGKSNVVDAVRWVLGEQSIKSLRGETATDIIFSGSKSRKPLNSASVTLVFDNSDLYLPIQYTEVSVRRVMYKTGENEYYLNNEKCRLKDITNLLTDTGADKTSFNIIGQGKIDEILSTKPSDRRVIFESAAGVLKYKKRKEEAVRKLERTNYNIDRVNDIIKELENNLTPLERQSKTAKKYLEKKQELTDLEISLMVHDIHLFNHQTKDLKTKIDSLKDELVELSNNNSTYDIDVLEKKDKVKQIEEEINKQQSLLIEITKSIEKIDANIKILKERKKYTENSIDESKERVSILKEELLKFETKIHYLEQELEKNKEILQNFTSQLETTYEKHQLLKTQKQKMNTNIEQKNRQLVDTKYRIEYLENKIQNDNHLPSSIKNILNNPRLNGAHNVIGKLIEVDNEYSLAISTSLGSASNYLVVDTSQDAKEMVKYLKENKLGRATFFPIDTIKPRTIEEESINRIKNVDGFVAVASSLVHYEDIYQNIILNQLGNVLVCKDLDSANYISKLLFQRYKIVTLDGQLVNIGGSITGGSSVNNNNILKDKYELDSRRLELQQLEVQIKELSLKLENITKEMNSYDTVIFDQKASILEYQEKMKQIENLLEEDQKQKEGLSREVKDIESITSHESDSELDKLLKMYYSAIENRDNITIEIDKLRVRKTNLEQDILEIETTSKQSNAYISNREKELKELEIRFNTMNIKLDNLLISLGEEYNMTYDTAFLQYKLEVSDEIARGRVTDLKSQIKELGYVNVEAIEEYEKVKSRYDFLINQQEDLRKAEGTLLEIIQEMDKIMKEKFITTFELIRTEFKKVFREMFHGGEAELVLTDPNNLLETGIEIQAIPSGKNLKSISLLSGGERTFTAISLLFSILNVRPVPFCLLDEVEAALDDANVESFGHYLDKYRDKTQFIIITHKKKTMEFVDVLYGITMQESGVSKLVSVRLADIEK